MKDNRLEMKMQMMVVMMMLSEGENSLTIKWID